MGKYEKDVGIEKKKYQPEEDRNIGHKSKRQTPKKSDHRHKYVDYFGTTQDLFKDGKVAAVRRRCLICGKDSLVRILWRQEDRDKYAKELGVFEE